MERRRRFSRVGPGVRVGRAGVDTGRRARSVTPRVRVAAVVAMLAMLGLSACGGDGDGGDGVTVDGAWARTSPALAEVGAAYMELSSSADDRLIGATVDPGIAVTVELHETVSVDDDGAEDDGGDHGDGDDHEGTGEMDGMGAMTMRQVSEIDIPSGETVALEPGGLHVMLIGLAAPLELDQTFDLTLEFENAGPQVVEVRVRDDRP